MASGAFIQSDAPTIALQVIGMCNWCWTWLDPNGRLSVDEVATIFVRTVMGGLVQGQDVPRTADILDAVGRIRQQLQEAA
jgi:protein-disulfide isomerase-like protein with CxxC motif